MAAALPLLLPQALWVKRTALRLPDAEQPWQGVFHPPVNTACSGGESAHAAPLRLLLIGESTVSGVGVTTQQLAFSGQLAAQLSTRIGRSVSWQACGRNGARVADCLRELAPQACDQQWDLVVIVLGVNDTTHLTPRPVWRRQMRELICAFSGSDARLLVTAVPPLGLFRALPQPLRAWFGLRAGLLDKDLSRLAPELGASHVAFDMPFEAECLAEDGYHPSALGYSLWASGLVAFLDQSGWFSALSTSASSGEESV